MNMLRTFSAKPYRTTRGFYFGDSEAEGENRKGLQNFMNYFEDFLGVLDRVEQGKFIVTGRKGAGKSAVAKYLNEHRTDKIYDYSSLIQIREYDTERLLQSKAMEAVPDARQAVYEWIILVRIGKLLLESKTGAYTPEQTKLNKFFNLNRGLVNIDKMAVTEMVSSGKVDVQFEGLKHIFSAFISKYIESRLQVAPFYRFIEPLREIIISLLLKDINNGYRYTLIFDDLDLHVNVTNKDASLTELMALIRTTKAFNTLHFKNTNARVVVMLREDFRDDLIESTPDAAKVFASYETSIKWHESETVKGNEKLNPIWKFINKRIAANFDEKSIPYNSDDPWSSLFSTEIGQGRGISSFKDALNQTFYRPRDLITMLNLLGEEDYRFPIDGPAFGRLSKKFSEKLVDELKSELIYVFSKAQINYIFQQLIPWLVHFRDSNGGKIRTSDLFKKLQDDGQITETYSPELWINLLYTYTILGFVMKSGSVFWSYREVELPVYYQDNEADLTLSSPLWNKYKAALSA